MRYELEKKLGYSIPNELDSLLNEDEQKYSELVFFIVLSDGYKYQNCILNFLTYKTFWEYNEYRDFLEDFQEQFELTESYVQSKYLYIIGQLNSGNVCIALNGIHKGKIYISDNGDFGITFQSNTLKEFLDSLYSYDDTFCSIEELKESVISKRFICFKEFN